MHSFPLTTEYTPFDASRDQKITLYSCIRDFFPVTRNLVYLNHAAGDPLCRPAAEAMQSVAQDALDWGSLHYDRWARML